jgi:hypothetical protein
MGDIMRIRIPYFYLLTFPAFMFGFGFILNAIVIALNHGQMPVQWPGGCDPDTMGDDIIHSCMASATHLKFLADWIFIRGVGVASPGDLLLWAGRFTFMPSVYAWLALVIKDENRKKLEWESRL